MRYLLILGPMNAEIISIGDELLIGQVVNTNASWLAQELNSIGISVNKIISIGDEENAIINTLHAAEKYADIIFITGGLGPTNDDITKYALCKYFSSSLIYNDAAYQNIVKLFASHNIKVSELNHQQAYLPDNCTPMPNPIGTAYGMWFEKDKKTFISMPGVPHEMKLMVEREVLPRLKEKFTLPVIIHKTILTQGIGESFLAEKIANWEQKLPVYIKLAYLPSPGVVRLRLSAKGNDAQKLQQEIFDLVAGLKSIIGEYIFGYDNETLEEIIGKLLFEKNQTIAAAESCTGGYISHLITSVAGSSAYFKGAIIAYANEIKEKELNVNPGDIKKHGAVSQEVAEQMANGIRKKYNTDYGIGITGIAGPAGGSEEKPVGTVWVAVASSKNIISKKFTFGDNRERNIKKAAVAALNMLRKEII